MNKPGKGLKSMKETIFYDGTCGLCHATVRFIARVDRAEVFQFAPIEGSIYSSSFDEKAREGFPDSLIVLTEMGEALVRSQAMLYIGRRLGGVWRLASLVGQIVPRFAADRIYDFIAGIRYRLFDRQNQACPVVPNELRSRFLE